MWRMLLGLLTIPFLVGIGLVVMEILMFSAESQVLKPDYPVLEIEVEQSKGQVHFQFYWGDTRGFPQVKVPVKVWELKVYQRDGNPTTVEEHLRMIKYVWTMVSSARSPSATQVTYGLVPPEFTQVEPPNRPAPPLMVNQEYFVSVRGEDAGIGVARFVYEGP